MSQRGISQKYDRLTDPRAGHERIVRQVQGVKSLRELDEDVRAAQGESRTPASDRPRVTGNLWDGSAFVSLLDVLERDGNIANEIEIDPQLHGPYENNQGILFRGVAPSIAAGAQLGASPSFDVVGSDITGRIVLTPGAGTTAGELATITFNVPRSNDDYRITFGAADDSAATAAGRSIYSNFATRLTTAWVLSCETALTAGVSYHWDYHIDENEEV